MSSLNTKTKIKHLPLTEVRNNLGKVVRRVHVNKEKFILEKGGIPVAVLIDIDDLEDYLELRDPKTIRQIKKSNEEYKQGKARPVEEFLAELKKESLKKY